MTRNPMAQGTPDVRLDARRPELRLLTFPAAPASRASGRPRLFAAGPLRSVGGATVAIAALGTVAARAALRRRRWRRDVEMSRNRAFADLLTAVRQRDEALAMASHDLKTPLTALKGQAQLLQRLLRTADAPEAERLRAGLAAIDIAATKAAARVDRLVDEAASNEASPNRRR